MNIAGIALHSSHFGFSSAVVVAIARVPRGE